MVQVNINCDVSFDGCNSYTREGDLYVQFTQLYYKLSVND